MRRLPGSTTTAPAPHGHPRQDARDALRTLYVRATDPECALPAGRLLDEIRAEIDRFTPAEQPSLEDLRSRAASWAQEERARYLSLLEGCGTDGGRDALIRRAALGCAPLALVSGAWLQWLSAPGDADDPATLRILALYASDVGAGHPRASRGAAYLTVLRQLLLSDQAAPPSRLAADPRIEGSAFYLPSLLLTMSRRPDDFRPEILGADLCLRTAGLLPGLALVKEATEHAAQWDLLDPGGSRSAGDTRDADRCRDAIGALVNRPPSTGGGSDTAARVATGFAWALAALQRWSEELNGRLEAALHPAFDMGELLRLRAREGAVYHHDFDLQGKPLSTWLEECRTDPGELLDVLAQSRLVKPGRSEASALVNGLVSERGPMFRVFSPEDLTVIRRWIDSLPPAGSGAQRSTPPSPRYGPAPEFVPSLDAEHAEGAADTEDAGRAPEDRAPADIREAYWMLQGRTAAPRLRHWSGAYIRGWLARSRHGIDRGGLQLPRAWPAEGLRPWLVEQHDRHGQEFDEGRETALPSREELIDSTVQLAPLTLIDGSWLQGFTDYGEASSEIGFSLFETYWDELGNGEPRLNHPLIYRDTLADMDVELPPTGSRAFSQWPGFRDSSFELPVYWLCIGRFPRTFLPEVLGLNLAMELSGVGGSYRRARLALKKHGFSTRFVDIHNTIDNVSSGHSAWAADAVDTFMSALPTPRISGVREEMWERVRTGYRSLNPPSGFRARQAARRAAARTPASVTDVPRRILRSFSHA